MDEPQATLNLQQFKDAIAAEIRPLIPHINDPEERFYALLALLRDKWDDGAAHELFEISKQLADPKVKVDALQQLMSEVGYRQRDLEDEAINPQSQQQEVPQQHPDQQHYDSDQEPGLPPVQ